MNLVPFVTIVDTLSGRMTVSGKAYVLGGNFLMLTPLALVALALTRRRHPVGFAAVVLAIAVGIEVTQYALNNGRSVDVDDVILNAAGAWLVYVMAARFAPSLVGWARPVAVRQDASPVH